MTAYSYEKTGDNFRVHDADDNRIATCWHEDNARFIVSRLNSRDELLAACKLILDQHDELGRDDPLVQAGLDAARAAIAKAEGQ